MSTGTEARLEAKVRSLVDRPLEVTLDFGPFGLPARRSLSLDPGETRSVQVAVPVPPLAAPGRASTTQLLAVGRCGRFSAFDTKWLTFSPVLHPDRASASMDDARLHWHSLTHDCLVMGEPQWEGESDLSGRFAVVEGEDTLTIVVDVTDDDITVAPAWQPVSFGDSVEVYLDFRAPEDQGKPVYGPEVVPILAVPGGAEGGLPRWQPLDRLVPMLVDLSFSCTDRPDGYRVTLSVPLRGIADRDAGHTGGFGLDVGINDADLGSTRKTQMFYCGHAGNYLDPSRLAGVSTDRTSRRLWRVTLR
jgi:hypothetical protein